MKLSSMEVNYSDLLLDPQNPRLAIGFLGNEGLDIGDPEGCQERIEERFRVTQERSDVQRVTEKTYTDDALNDENEAEDDFFSVRDLIGSMRRIGFVGIQNIIVREHPGTGKYIVLEGNRRVAAIRSVIREHEAAIVGAPGYIDDEDIFASLKSIKVMVFDTDGRSEEVVRDEISTMLGLRHYGSQLKWDLLPRAKNIYDEYCRLLDGQPFSYSSGKAKTVAATLAINAPEVKQLLRGYLCYKQLARDYDVKPQHFSLILAGAGTPGLTMSNNEYFEIDKSTFELGDDTPEKFDAICEFSDRDTKDYEKIIKDPKQFRKLGQLMKDSLTAPDSILKGMALAYFTEVIHREIALDDAHSLILAYKKRQKWVPEIRKLLDKHEQDEEKGGDLSLETFLGQGQQQKHFEGLAPLVKRFMVLIDHEK